MNNLQEFTLPNLSHKMTFPVRLTEENISGTLATVFATGYYSDSTDSTELPKPFENVFANSFQLTGNAYLFDVANNEYAFLDIVSRLQSTKISFEDEGVLLYLKKRFHLVRLLNSAQKKLNAYFTDKKTWYFLRQTYSSDGLVLEVHTPQNGETALAMLEKFEDEWWLDNMPVNSDKILIDVMFV